MISPRTASPILAAGVLSLAACGDTTDVEGGNTVQVEAEPVDVDGEVPLALQPLAAADLDVASLVGDLGCAFSDAPGEDPLLAAYAFMAADGGADAAIKLNGEVVPLSMTGAGGYERLADGAAFMGGDLMVEVAVNDNEPLDADPQVARESPAVAARLTVSQLAQEIAIDGVYQCGPE